MNSAQGYTYFHMALGEHDLARVVTERSPRLRTRCMIIRNNVLGVCHFLVFPEKRIEIMATQATTRQLNAHE